MLCFTSTYIMSWLPSMLMIYSGRKQGLCIYCDQFFQEYLQDWLGIQVFKFKIGVSAIEEQTTWYWHHN